MELEQKDMKNVINHMLSTSAVSDFLHITFLLAALPSGYWHLRDECYNLVVLGPNLSRSLDCLNAMLGSLVDLVQFLVRIFGQCSHPRRAELLVGAGNIEARVTLDRGGDISNILGIDWIVGTSRHQGIRGKTAEGEAHGEGYVVQLGQLGTAWERDWTLNYIASRRLAGLNGLMPWNKNLTPLAPPTHRIQTHRRRVVWLS